MNGFGEEKSDLSSMPDHFLGDTGSGLEFSEPAAGLSGLIDADNEGKSMGSATPSLNEVMPKKEAAPRKDGGKPKPSRRNAQISARKVKSQRIEME